MLLSCDRDVGVRIPGGFGAAGGRNDQWHNSWRLLRKSWLRKAIGGDSNPAFGRKMADLDFNLHGEVNLSCPLLVSLAADVYAIQALANHCSENIVTSVWLKTGYISKAELAV